MGTPRPWCTYSAGVLGNSGAVEAEVEPETVSEMDSVALGVDSTTTGDVTGADVTGADVTGADETGPDETGPDETGEDVAEDEETVDGAGADDVAGGRGTGALRTWG